MTSLILATATRYLLPLLILFSLFLLFDGHHEPGGGFVGGLLAASPLALCALAYDVSLARRVMMCAPQQFIATGLLLAGSSGVLSLVAGQPFLKSLWGTIYWPNGKLEIGTPLLFDFGVYLGVIGVVMLIVLTLAEESP